MDLEVQIKAEPVWLEDEANTSLGNFEFVSALKEETNSELPEPGPSQENTFEPFADIEGEISKEQHSADELTPNTKQGNNGSNVAVLMEHTGQQAGTVRRKAILHKSNVKKFISAPSGERPYRCRECNSSFTWKGSFRDHMIAHTGEGPFKCNECNKSFARKFFLQKHMVTHSGPYHCMECNRSFARKGNLQNHMAIHGGESLYRCEECRIWFTQKNVLLKHMATHS